MKRGIHISLILLCITASLSVAGCQPPAWRNGTAELQAETATARQEKIPLSLKDLQKPLPPKSENAAPLYKNLHWPGNAEKELYDFTSLTAPTPAQVASAKKVLAICQPGLASMHTAVRLPYCVFDRTWDIGSINFVVFPELAHLRSATRQLNAESLLLAYDGKYEEAVRNQALGFQIAHHAYLDNMLTSYLVGKAIDALALSNLRKILLISQGDEKAAIAVRSAIESQWHPQDLTPALKSEAAIHQEMIQPAYQVGFVSFLSEMQSSSEEPEAQTKLNELKLKAQFAGLSKNAEKALIDANVAFMLRQMRKTIAVIDQPYPQALPSLSAFEKETNDSIPTHFFAQAISPSWQGALSHKTSGEAFAAVVRAGATVLQYRAAHAGQLPHNLSDALPAVPIDPFNGKPLQYRLEGNGKGFVVYSVGPDGTFDGGQPGTAKTAISPLIFRYPLAP